MVIQIGVNSVNLALYPQQRIHQRSQVKHTIKSGGAADCEQVIYAARHILQYHKPGPVMVTQARVGATATKQCVACRRE